MLEKLEQNPDPNLLVGIKTMDDAGVYRLSDGLAIVNTVDFITPPVDDPYWFGQIAAANSISDVYCMNGVPVTAMNLVMFPSHILDLGVLQEILHGGYDIITQAGAALVGGHSIVDDEPKYGLSLTGKVDPEQIWTNGGAQPGDALVLTKALGTGVLFNAVRAGKFPYAQLEREVLPQIAMLNRAARETAQKYQIHGCTDVTGFGIMGHALEMAQGAGLSLIINYHTLPYFDGAVAMYEKRQTTRSNKSNREMLDGSLEIALELTRAQNELLFDPQTSGGLLFALPRAQAHQMVAELNQAGMKDAALIGEVVEEGPTILLQ